MMTSITLVIGLLVLLAMLPKGIKWAQTKLAGGSTTVNQASSVISAIAVGPQQRVVTVEVGPRGDRTWLVLGVTAQSVSLLHSLGHVSEATAAKGVDK